MYRSPHRVQAPASAPALAILSPGRDCAGRAGRVISRWVPAALPFHNAISEIVRRRPTRIGRTASKAEVFPAGRRRGSRVRPEEALAGTAALDMSMNSLPTSPPPALFRLMPSNSARF